MDSKWLWVGAVAVAGAGIYLYIRSRNSGTKINFSIAPNAYVPLGATHYDMYVAESGTSTNKYHGVTNATITTRASFINVPLSHAWIFYRTYNGSVWTPPTGYNHSDKNYNLANNGVYALDLGTGILSIEGG